VHFFVGTLRAYRAPLNSSVRTMNLCPTCGAPLENPTEACPFDVSEEQAPWRADYEAMARGQMTHEEHQVLVARWALHNESSQSERALQKLRVLGARNRGRVVKLFKLEGQ
ncbi:hypothetical protein, partial [Frateuria sp.]|uniref:hypothetical protein n=1 Tax=Frateuria sp. TaxID=2211372 RepID=UPI0025BB31E2